ncbi:Na+/H+ antiporter NhaA [Propionibacterium sp.]|uniref:Na+/H+ antiporter NhaA n=1 Tax=Propionibacterium sp. TaxID=1977903 RepID=UPI0039E9F4EC
MSSARIAAPLEAFAALSGFTFGSEALHLNLSVSAWAAGLLAVFLSIVGVELKHEIVAGSLRNPREAPSRCSLRWNPTKQRLSHTTKSMSW